MIKQLLQCITLSALLLGNNIHAIAVAAFTLIHPDTKQTIVLFGDYHTPDFKLSAQIRDAHVKDMVDALQELKQQGAEIYYEPTVTESKAFNLMMLPIFEPLTNNPTEFIMTRVGKDPALCAYYAHDIERAGLADMLWNANDTILWHNWPTYKKYFGVAVAFCIRSFKRLEHIQHLPQYKDCLASLDALSQAVAGGCEQFLIWRNNNKSHIDNIGLPVADLTTFSYILSNPNNIVLYIGDGHARNLKRLLEQHGFVTSKGVAFINDTGHPDTRVISGLTQNSSCVQQLVLSYFDYQDMSCDQLRKINLLVRLITNEKSLHTALAFFKAVPREYLHIFGLEKIQQLAKTVCICRDLHRTLSQEFLTIDPNIFTYNAARTQTAAEEVFVIRQRELNQKNIDSIRSTVQFALDNIEQVYDTVPGLNL